MVLYIGSGLMVDLTYDINCDPVYRVLFSPSGFTGFVTAATANIKYCLFFRQFILIPVGLWATKTKTQSLVTTDVVQQIPPPPLPNRGRRARDEIPRR